MDSCRVIETWNVVLRKDGTCHILSIRVIFAPIKLMVPRFELDNDEFCG